MSEIEKKPAAVKKTVKKAKPAGDVRKKVTARKTEKTDAKAKPVKVKTKAAVKKPAPKPAKSDGKLKITLKRSIICTRRDHRATVSAMGLKRINSSVIMPDNPATRGMIRKVQYLVSFEEVAK